MTDLEIPLGKRTAKYRFFEMLPAICSYGLVLLPIILSLISPLLGATFVIGYIIMWFVKAIGIAYRTVQGYHSLEQAQKVNWRARLEELNDVDGALAKYRELSQKKEWRLQDHYQNLLRISARPQDYFVPNAAFNAVIIPTYNEPREIIELTLKALFASQFDARQLILILAYESRSSEESKQLVQELAKKYSKKCFHVHAIMHPEGLPGEVIGKGGNITYAGRYLQTYLAEQKIDPERVLVTTLDADNRAHPQYLAYAMYEYICDTQRDRRAFQPIALFLNNIWDVPAPMRVLATGNSFWTIINSMRPHMLRNFAAHSQGMASLNKTDLWSTRTIVEDGHQYWRSYFAFDGHYEVTPIYVPIYQDAVLAETYRKTMKAQFVQLRRWAYGASDIAYVADKGFGKHRTVPLVGLVARFLRLLDSHVSWASASIIITFGAWIPLIINSDASRSIVAHELPVVASQLQFIAMFGLFIAIFLTFKMLPPRPERYKRRRNVAMLAQWLIMPIVSLCYGSSAAFNSQTRLLLGRYLDKFDTTTKFLKK